MIVDYREILKKYMRHIANMEGYTFVNDLRISQTEKEVSFTKEEQEALKEIDKEVREL